MSNEPRPPDSWPWEEPPDWSEDLLGAAPPEGPSCPACHHTLAHHPSCELKRMSIEVANLLGYERALARLVAADLVPGPDTRGEDRSAASTDSSGGLRAWLRRLGRGGDGISGQPPDHGETE